MSRAWMNDNLDQKQPGAKIDGNPQGSIIDLPPELTHVFWGFGMIAFQPETIGSHRPAQRRENDDDDDAAATSLFLF